MTTVVALRQAAETEAARLPALLARADHLAATVLLGTHGRRRSGLGDDFWQYRAMRPGDSYRSIDWRRSARGDAQYVREREWQIAQSILLGKLHNQRVFLQRSNRKRNDPRLDRAVERINDRVA